jgi:hypothetical protein
MAYGLRETGRSGMKRMNFRHQWFNLSVLAMEEALYVMSLT